MKRKEKREPGGETAVDAVFIPLARGRVSWGWSSGKLAWMVTFGRVPWVRHSNRRYNRQEQQQYPYCVAVLVAAVTGLCIWAEGGRGVCQTLSKS
ncbi:hypothetical protein IF1G_06641 [Cordyceps javanica]|uniref:Uncharacterized protein n=1 Tax=Cordyceps javanica TaxID=43265 RepID=A0A545UYR8_9HYPO|nr:hypothetical protein IF1G_06641 [Cordyceps javanica]